jgi:hypothetical protein
MVKLYKYKRYFCNNKGKRKLVILLKPLKLAKVDNFIFNLSCLRCNYYKLSSNNFLANILGYNIMKFRYNYTIPFN